VWINYVDRSQRANHYTTPPPRVTAAAAVDVVQACTFTQNIEVEKETLKVKTHKRLPVSLSLWYM